MGGPGSGGHSKSGKKSNAEKERIAAEREGRTLNQIWSNQTRNASESGSQEFLQHSAARNNDEIKSPEIALEETPPIVRSDDTDSECDEQDDDDHDQEENKIEDFDDRDEESVRDADTNVPTYVKDLVEVVKRNFENKSGYYLQVRMGNFWIFASNALIKLKISNNSIHPDSFFAKNLFIWCPITAFPDFEFSCIESDCSGSLTFEGWPSDPCARRVYSLGYSYFIVGHQYSCRKCGKKFLSTNSSFLRSLPSYIQDIFPAWLTHRGGFDKNLLTEIYNLTGDGTCISSIRNSLKELFYVNYDKCRFQYYTYSRDLVFGSRMRRSRHILLSPSQGIVVFKFGTFSSKSGYNERIPSTNYIISLIKKKHDSLKQWYDNRVSMLSVEHLKIDHSHKVTGRIRFNSVKIFSGLFTAVNEFNQIRLQNFVFSKSLEEVSPSLISLSKVLQNRNESFIKSVATDNCCQDRRVVQECIPSLQRTDELSSNLPYFELPSGTEIITVLTEQEIEQICPVISSASAVENVVLGIDAEWNVSEKRKVALFQISFKSFVYLIRFSKIKHLNSQVVDIILNPKIIKTGRNVGGDIRALFRDFCPHLYLQFENLKLPGVVELGKLASISQVVDSGTASLDIICQSVLRKRLRKDDLIRFSDWEATNLEEKQVKYAAIDAYVSKIIYERLNNMSPQRFEWSNQMHVGQIVYILPTTTCKVLGVGKILSTEHLSREELQRINPRNDRSLVLITNVLCADAMIGIKGKKERIELGKSVWLYTYTLCLNGSELLDFQSHKVSAKVPQDFEAVVGDGFHVLHQFNIPKHVFRKSFFESFREALFMPNADDMELVKRKLFNGKEDEFKLLLSSWPEYFSKRIWRTIPSAEILKARLERVFTQFKDLKDVDGKKLFNSSNIQIMKNILKHAGQGCYSDNPDINWYEKLYEDANGIPVYRSLRGTSIVESIHQKLIQCFSAFEASPSFADAVLRMIRHRINTRAGIRYNGDYCCGHYEQYYIEGIQQVTLELFGKPMHPSWKTSEDWVSNQERFGIVEGKYPDIVNLIPSGSADLKSSELKFLKKNLNLEYPFLPIHSDAEHKLFVSCMRENFRISGMLEEFAKKSNGIDIFPKLKSHIEKHMKTWKEFGRNNLLRLQVDKGIKAMRSELLLNIANNDDIINEEESDSELEIGSDEDMEITTPLVDTDSVSVVSELFSNPSNIIEEINSVSVPSNYLEVRGVDPSMVNENNMLIESNPISVNNADDSLEVVISEDYPNLPILVTHLPSFVLGSVGSQDQPRPYYIQRDQNMSFNEECDIAPRKQKKRCVKRHSTNPNLVCGREDCKGSGNKSLCTTPESEFIVYVRSKKRKSQSSSSVN
jgi:ribonuclease D